MPASDPIADRSAQRRRSVGVLVGGVALGSTGHIAAVTVTSLVAQEIGGDRSLAGLPAAAAVLGAVVAIAGIVILSLPIVLLGSLAVGFGNSSNQLSRYAAADMYPTNRRASAIGTVVWAATVGAVIGPNLVEPSGVVAVAVGLPRLAGPYLVPVVLVALAALLSFIFLRPDPRELADDSGPPGELDIPAAS